MKKRLLAPLAIAIALAGCQSYDDNKNQTKESQQKIKKVEHINPLFSAFTTPHGIPPFDQIKKFPLLPMTLTQQHLQIPLKRWKSQVIFLTASVMYFTV
jgi:PBP1b-binding outer membrane lipoprotein LpoB